MKYTKLMVAYNNLIKSTKTLLTFSGMGIIGGIILKALQSPTADLISGVSAIIFISSIACLMASSIANCVIEISGE